MAAAPLIFPRLQGQGWSSYRRPMTSTRVATHVSGREVRTGLFVNPLYEFEVKFDVLSSDTRYPGAAERSLQEMQGFILACGGQLSPFLFIDPVDHTATGQAIGIGDGSTRTFPFLRSVGSKFVEPVGWVTSITAVYLNGAKLDGSAWTLAQPANLTFAVPPAIATEILADFNYAFVCRFGDDVQEFEHFMLGLWQMSSLKFRTFR